MIIKSLELKDFRNYERLSMDFDEKTNIIYGDNAQGKTNILEAVYVSGTSKSHKGSREKDMIRFGQSEAHIKTIVQKKDREYRIDIHLKKNRSKGIAINRIPVKKASDLFGILNVIFFSPEDLNIIKAGPDKRRRFIDSELCQLDKLYLYNLTNYNKILNQRNKLLKDIYYNPSLKSTLDVWDEQMSAYGEKIIERRRQFTDEIFPIVKDLHEKISGGTEILNMEYEPDVTAADLRQKLADSREKDLKTGQTNVGPHRDDLSFTIDDVDVRKFGSQGQQRTCALSLKLSGIRLVDKIMGEKPVLLLDDVMSELDENRQNFLLNSLYDTQTIITCTGLNDFVKNRFPVNRVFEVISGNVEEKNGNQ